MPDPAPLDQVSDSEATMLRKAGEGALGYALRTAGWTDEAAGAVADPELRTGLGWESARDVLQTLATEARNQCTYYHEES